VLNLNEKFELLVGVVENGLFTVAVFVVALYEVIYLLSPADGPESIVNTTFRYALLVGENLPLVSKN
jgi:hypothetical protein